MLHVIGAPLSVILAVIQLEITLLALVALSVGIPAGLGLAWCLVAVVNPLSFGFRFPLVLDWATLELVVGVLGVGVALVLLATGTMMRRFARDESRSVVG